MAVADGPDDFNSELTNYQDRFMKNIGWSAGAHVAIVLLFTLKIFLFSDESTLHQSAMRVDLVALPDKIKDMPAPTKVQAEPPPTQKKPMKAEPVPEKTVVLNPKKVDIKKKQQDALNRLKQMSAIEDLEKQVKIEKTSAISYKGNQVVKGSDLRGLSLLQRDAYVSDVEKHIRRFWILPQWLANKDLHAKIRVRFDENGSVTGREIVRSSGNPSFDEAVMNTLEKASPVPKPPDKLQKILAYEGILVGFPD